MAERWKKVRPGIRYRLHPTRRHGMGLDKYWTLFYKLDGKTVSEALGWSSQGFNEKKAVAILSELQENRRRGTGPRTLMEKRQLEDDRRSAEQAEQKKQEIEGITFGQFFKETYLPTATLTKKPKTLSTEKGYFQKWLKPVIGNKPFKSIHPLDFERIKSDMLKVGRAPRSLQYCMAIFRQVWNQARRNGLINRESPTKEVKLLKIDNKRMRFLTHDEADRLLDNLSGRSKQLHDMALLSLHTGLRAGEIFSLTWGNVDIEQRIIYIVDAKGGSRTAHMTDRVKQMFKNMVAGQLDELVFKDRRHGGRIKQISSSFDRAIDALSLNSGVTDPRQKVLFHSLRHTFASWLVQQGTPLYTVQKLMGHSSISMTERYSHLAPDTLKSAIKSFEKNINDNRKIVKLYSK
ncbi:Integrase family protein [uncultured Desulfobacterium sp.]|uniref:Integrase family protein n=1 Tax=uncultured Desulfobacterium sp. TaxID=201089 RepID=A0A445N1U9_9BACT|nr:Integrase family protein [uncultured Desulfobacterium sp.]